jgi:hypothetical protein
MMVIYFDERKRCREFAIWCARRAMVIAGPHFEYVVASAEAYLNGDITMADLKGIFWKIGGGLAGAVLSGLPKRSPYAALQLCCGYTSYPNGYKAAQFCQRNLLRTAELSDFSDEQIEMLKKEIEEKKKELRINLYPQRG